MPFETESILLYFLFNLIIIVFGYVNIQIFIKQQPFGIEPNFVRRLLVSWGIGLSLYLFVMYIFITVWNFNLFTGYIFFIAYDIAGLIYLWKKSRNLQSEIDSANDFKTIMKKYLILINKNLGQILSFCIFIFILYFYITAYYFEDFVLSSTAHPGSYDSYLWEGNLYYLIVKQTIDYKCMNDHTVGFLFWTGSMLLPFPGLDIREIHFFDKMIPIMFLVTNIVILFLLVYDLFPKRKYAPFVASLSIFVQFFFLYRSFMFLPTILTTFQILLILYTFIHSDLPKVYSGILFGSTLLVHPLYSAALIICLAVFILVMVFFYDPIESEQKMNLLLKFKYRIKNMWPNWKWVIIPVILYFMVMSINFMIYISLDFYKYYFGFLDLNILDPLNEWIDYVSDYWITYYKIINWNTFWYEYIFPPDISYQIRIFTDDEQLNSILFFFAILSFFLPLNRIFPKRQNIINFSKIMCLILIIMFFFQIFYQYSPIRLGVIDSLLDTYLYDVFQPRITELTATPMLILGVFSIVAILIGFEKIIHYPFMKILNRNNTAQKSQKLMADKTILITDAIGIFLIFLIIDEGMIGTFYRAEDYIDTGLSNYNGNDDELLFNLRDIQDKYFLNNNISYGKVYYSPDYRKLDWIMRFYFALDNNITFLWYPANYSTDTFLSYLKTLETGSLIVLCDRDPFYSYIQLIFPTVGTFEYKNGNYFVIRKN